MTTWVPFLEICGVLSTQECTVDELGFFYLCMGNSSFGIFVVLLLYMFEFLDIAAF